MWSITPVPSLLPGLGRPRGWAPFSPLGESMETLCGLGPLQDTGSILLGGEFNGREHCPGGGVREEPVLEGSGVSGNKMVLTQDTSPPTLQCPASPPP